MKKGMMLLVGMLLGAGVMSVKAQGGGRIEVNNPGAGGSGWTVVQESGGSVVRITEGGSYTLTGSTSQNRVVVESGVTASVMLANCSMSSSVAAPLTLDGGGANVTLKVVGNNRLTSTGIHCGVEVEDAAALTIEGEGALTVTGGQFAAAIGARWRENSANPSVVVASRVGKISIRSGNIIANGGQQGAGIGGCTDSNGGTITITGGTITATGGQYAAGIGSGWNGASGTIRITGGTITASGGDYAAGIGGGRSSALCDTIIISGGAVTATGGDYAAGIGKGADGAGESNIIISGGVTAGISGPYGAGIGGGQNASAGNISIHGGAVYACGIDINEHGDAGAGIGAGFNPSGNNDPTNNLININGGMVVANRIGLTTAYNTTLTYVHGGAILTDEININNSFGNASINTDVNISQALVKTMAANHAAIIKKTSLATHDTTRITLYDTLRITSKDTLTLIQHDTTFQNIHDTIEQIIYTVIDNNTWEETRVDNQLQVTSDGDQITLIGLDNTQPFAIYNTDGDLILRVITQPFPLPNSGAFIVAQSRHYYTFVK